jgi:DNA adenine methylase
MEAWTTPFLRWAGSKRTLLPELHAVYREAGCTRYVEPFAGSACLFFASHPKRAVIGDRNRELVDSYTSVRDHPRLVSRRIREWASDETEYYAVRNLDASSLDSVTRAARFIYLNRYCFNGLYRTNKMGGFNVPYGSHTGQVPSEAHLYRCSVALRKADLCCGDFSDTTANVRQGDFVYLDPPYTRSPQHAYGVYGYGSFSETDMTRMLETLHRINEAGAVFLFSYADIEGLGSELSVYWNVRNVSTRSSIASRPSARRHRSEILVTNLRRQPRSPCWQ